MNGQTVTLFCDDVLNDVNFDQTWQANATNLGAAIQNINFSQTRYGGVPSSLVYGNAAHAYQEAAWLTTQFGSNSSNYTDLQYTLSFLMNPNLTKYDTAGAQVWLGMAGKDYRSIDPNDFLIVTNTSSANNPLALTGGCRNSSSLHRNPICDGCLRHIRSSNHSFPPRAAKRIEADHPFWRRP
jgi:hypothetical protein